MLVFASVAALAEVSITINRDATYADSDTNYARKYTYLKVFDATKDANSDAISYTLSSSDPWLTAIQGASATNTYFDLTPNASRTLYYVTAKTGVNAKMDLSHFG